MNLTAALVLAQACSRLMLRQGSGCIVNISSVNAIRGHTGVAVYSATKAALDGLTRSLARELGPRKIRVNSVAPGYFESDMIEWHGRGTEAAHRPAHAARSAGAHRRGRERRPFSDIRTGVLHHRPDACGRRRDHMLTAPTLDADRIHRARQDPRGPGGARRRVRKLSGTDKLNATLGLSSLDLAFLVAELEAELGVDPFAKLVSITSVRSVEDLVRAYQQALFPELDARRRRRRGLAAAVKRAQTRRGAEEA